MTRELEVKIKEIIQRTYNVKSFRVGVDGKADFQAGQFLEVTLKTEPELKKYLSISSVPTEKGYLEFTKKDKGVEIAKAIKSDKKGMDKGIGFEKDSILFYEGMKKVVPEYDRKILDELILQEQSHLRKLSDLKKNLS